MRREQRDQLAARQRRPIDASVAAGLGSNGGGAAYASPFSLYSDPLAAMDVTTADAVGEFTSSQDHTLARCILPQGVGQLATALPCQTPLVLMLVHAWPMTTSFASPPKKHVP
jgi:hypothetical protein